MDSFAGSDPVRRRFRRLTKRERLEEATAFIRQFARETGMAEADMKARMQAVKKALKTEGAYRHTPEELAFGARVAWRNHSRCIGRLVWKSLEVFDCRALSSPAEVAAQLFEHLRLSLESGSVRPIISIFAPATAADVPVTFESEQALQYAGYALPDGSILGDTKNIEITRTARALGWRPPEPPTAFDLLPIVLRDGKGHRHIFDLPDGISTQISIEHPVYPAVGQLGLRWYPVPCVANMTLTIGGIDYPCAPFSGHYMATEIASRDFGDARRYDMLEEFARAIGLDTANDALWKDAALTEMNRAVLHSFRRAGIRIVDHHEASAQFMEFMKLEQREGRTPSSDWSWLVPPQAAAACPIFHLPMTDLGAVPNFYVSRHLDGARLRLYRGHERRRPMIRRYHWWLDHWRDWRRQRDYLWQRH